MTWVTAVPPAAMAIAGRHIGRSSVEFIGEMCKSIEIFDAGIDSNKFHSITRLLQNSVTREV